MTETAISGAVKRAIGGSQQPQACVVDSVPRDLFTVAQFSERRQAWSQASLRNLILNAEHNGLAEAGAIVRCGRRVLLDEEAFFRWLAAQQRRGRA